jgi:anti-sigma regulatory factor (Ser/Thr protein kinase)
VLRVKDRSTITVTPSTGCRIVTPSASPCLALELDPASARTARLFTRTLLAGDPHELVDDVEMVACELVTNAIVHAPENYVLPPYVPPLIHLSLQKERRWILVGVRDPWPDIPRTPETEHLDEHGRGLRIVYTLAAGCWTRFRDVDKTVYAVVTRPGEMLTSNELERLRRA